MVDHGAPLLMVVTVHAPPPRTLRLGTARPRTSETTTPRHREKPLPRAFEHCHLLIYGSPARTTYRHSRPGTRAWVRIGEIMIFGRQPELRALQDMVDRAARGQGGLLVLRGGSGIGKSVLLAEARTRAAARGLDVRTADHGPLDAEIAFGTAHRLLGTRETGLGADVTYPVLHALFRQVAHLAAGDGALFAVDDLQWCDAASLRWLAYLAHRCEELPILIVACLNDAEPPAEPGLVCAVCAAGTQLTLTGLDEDATDVWMRTTLTGTGPALRQTCHRLTGGNPFLLTQLVTAFARDGIPENTGSLSRFTAEGLDRRIRQRLVRASGGARTLARSLTVADGQMDITLLARLTGLEVETAAGAVAELVAAEIVADASPIRFAHTLLRNAVDSDLFPAFRRATHARVATLLRETSAPAEAIAAHLVKAGPPREAWMIQTLTSAATSPQAREAPDMALAFLRHALTGPGQDRSALLRFLGVLEVCHGGERGPAHLAESLALSGEPTARAASAAGLAWCPEPPQNNMNIVEQALDQADASQKADVACSYSLTLAGRAVWFRPGPAHRSRVEFLRDRIRDQPWERPLSSIAEACLSLMAGTSAATALTHARQAVRELLGSDLYRQIPSGSDFRPPGGLAQIVLGQAAWTYIYADETDEALVTVTHEGFTDGQFGHATAEATRQYIRGLAHLRAGDLRHARDELEAGIRYIQVSGEANTAWYAGRVTAYVDLLVTLGEHSHLLELRDSPRGRSAMTHLHDHQPFLLQRGRNLAALGEFGRAVKLMDRAGVLAVERHTDNPALMPWRSEVALVRLAMGDRKAARDLTGEEVERARHWGAALTLSRALARHGRTMGEPEIIEEALGLLTAGRADCQLAHGLVLLGETLLEKGRRDDAVRQLMRGYDAAVRCGAGLYANHAASALAVAGARPRLTTGVRSLTRQERIIARRAAEGATNRQIAEELLLNLRTVEQHLTSVYRKLEIAGRAGLRTALGDAHPGRGTR
ncbi:AAA family ATPase [Streptomyces sp. NPDC001787]|uniref:ATP-binding protein n=1 Tax=Streptomyces sp. NPDC001787 TaxID=3154523 RepID=UPI0033327185